MLKKTWYLNVTFCQNIACIKLLDILQDPQGFKVVTFRNSYVVQMEVLQIYHFPQDMNLLSNEFFDEHT